jgi:hypothetical protein
MRPSLAKLWTWRYKQLENLPVTSGPEFCLANAGFLYDYQVRGFLRFWREF